VLSTLSSVQLQEVHHLAASLYCERVGSAQAKIEHDKHKKSLEHEQNGQDVPVHAVKT
jgi:hypothetical protein